MATTSFSASRATVRCCQTSCTWVKRGEGRLGVGVPSRFIDLVAQLSRAQLPIAPFSLEASRTSCRAVAAIVATASFSASRATVHRCQTSCTWVKRGEGRLGVGVPSRFIDLVAQLSR
eukprot:SAG25_NODE_9657_length_363_cov_3.268939_1_plen_117_part_10